MRWECAFQRKERKRVHIPRGRAKKKKSVESLPRLLYGFPTELENTILTCERKEVSELETNTDIFGRDWDDQCEPVENVQPSPEQHCHVVHVPRPRFRKVQRIKFHRYAANRHCPHACTDLTQRDWMGRIVPCWTFAECSSQYAEFKKLFTEYCETGNVWHEHRWEAGGLKWLVAWNHAIETEAAWTTWCGWRGLCPIQLVNGAWWRSAYWWNDYRRRKASLQVLQYGGLRHELVENCFITLYTYEGSTDSTEEKNCSYKGQICTRRRERQGRR